MLAKTWDDLVAIQSASWDHLRWSSEGYDNAILEGGNVPNLYCDTGTALFFDTKMHAAMAQ